MSIQQLLEEARSRGVRLWVEGERLRYEAPKGTLTDGILQRLRQGKAELIQHLRDPQAIETHPVSFGQRSLWFEYQRDPASAAYNYAFSARMQSRVDVEALHRSFQAIVDRHAVLRTTYSLVDGDPVQHVHAYQAVAFAHVDAAGWSGAELSERVRASAHRPFDLRHGPVLRVEVYTRSATEHVLLLNAHHIAMDFRSLGVIVEELERLYAAECGVAVPAVPVVRTQYADYARWQRELVDGESGEAHAAFWADRLGSRTPLLDLPTDRPRPAVRTYNGAALRFELGDQLSGDVKALARAERVTLYTLLLSAFETLLHRYSGQDEFLVGSPMLGRTRPEFERVLGYFISPVVLRARFEDDPSFRELLQRTHREVLSAMEHQDYPFAMLVQRLQPARDASRSPFFDVMFNLNAADLDEAANANAAAQEATAGGLGLQAEPQAQGEGQFDLILQIFDAGRSLTGTLEYNTDLFDAATMERMAGHLRMLLAGIVADPRQRVSQLPLLTQTERLELLQASAGSGQSFPVTTTLHELFEQQVARTPESPAVTFEGRTLCYRELNEQANRVARRLRGLGVGPEALVAICVERSLDMVVGLLGILKAGGAYVPLDPAYPAERLAHMLADSNAPVLLTQTSLRGQLPPCTAQVICLDADDPQLVSESCENPPASAMPGHPAYVIYTSGSTGRPKGVVVCHEQVVRLFTATQDWFGFNDRDVWTLFHSFAFDFSVWELWGALLYGGRLVVVPYLVSRSPEAFCRLVADERVTVLSQTPSAFRQFVEAEAAAPLPKPASLRYVIFGGEALDLRSLRPWYQRHGERRPLLVNMYGITETTVHVTYRPLCWADVDAGRGSMIGRAIPDLQLYVLDRSGEPVPVGIPGELYVGGAGLARGYLNQPGLTADRFVAHPFSSRDGERLYRTGDLARRHADGDIEYLGRVDQQVKIRGFRIEVGEIEAVLQQCPGVAGAVVTAVGEVGGDKRLVAYVRAAAGAQPTVDQLRQHARTCLPEYMVPAAFVFLDTFPLTPSGKIDRKSLPTVDAARPELESRFAAPDSLRERLLAEVWTEVLGIDDVGMDDNFFSLGGDSILSIRVIAAARERGVELTLADIFQHQTVRELAAVGQPEETEATEPTEAVMTAAPFSLISPTDRETLPDGIEDAYPLARLQAGMLFHAQLNPDAAVYCNLSSLHLRMPFDLGKLQDAVDAVVAAHPALRTSFDMTSFSEPLQLVHRHVCVPLNIEDIRYLEPQEQEWHLREWIDRERWNAFDPSRTPLLRFHVHLRSDDRLQLTWCEHHAILDGWSVASMLTEIIRRYLAALGCAEAIGVVERPAGEYRDFVAIERQTIESAEQRAFWRDRLAGVSAARLPRWERADQVEPRRRFGQHAVKLPGELSSSLHSLARRLGVPIKSVLLAAHLKVLAAWSGRRDVLTGLISNGRPETVDSERVLGLYLNTVPFKASLEPGRWSEFVQWVNAGEREVLPYRRYPLADIQRAIGTQDLIETSFNFIHFHVYQGLSKLGPLEVFDAKAYERTNFTLMATFSVDPMADQPEVGLTLHYDAHELCRAQAEAMGESYAEVLRAMAADADARHETASVLPNTQRSRILETFNATAAERPPAVCLHELFAAQADRTPKAIALTCGGRSLTYAELRARSQRLARYLRLLGVGPEVMVGVCMERTADLVVALLAILEAGGAYVPLDAAYPAERLQFILDDAKASIVLTTSGLADRVRTGRGRVVCVDAIRGVLQSMESEPLDNLASASNLAYVIYTSGSTGRPKGVAIEHRSACELMRWARETYCDEELSGVLASTSICFDLSVFEIFVPLSWGGRVVLVGNALTLTESGSGLDVTLINTVPSAMTELVRLHAIPETVRTVNLAGEPLRPALVDEIYATGTVQRVCDLYGPSEDTTYSTCAERTVGGPAIIGRPISNTRAYILDAMLQPVPIGATGELYLAGAGLARGYFERPELTAERFIPEPFGAEPGGRMYRTGDLARYRADGDIEFLGRSDHQVKLRGFRIELGEIETALHACAGVSSAVVSVVGDERDRRLVAYYVNKEGAAAAESDLRNQLAARLPAYMVPSAFMLLPAMPMTPNGKIDRKALPVWQSGGEPGDRAIAGPSDAVEEQIVRCWQELLGVERISVDENFFELGGHSLLATQVISRLRETFGVPLALRAIFDAPTVAGMAAIVRAARPVDAPAEGAKAGEREEIEL